MLPFNTVSFRGSSLPGYCQKVTIILQAISLKLIQRRKHNIAIPNTECRGSSALCYIDCCNLPGKCTTYGCFICGCVALQHSFISRVQSARLLPENDNNFTSNFFKTYSNTQTPNSECRRGSSALCYIDCCTLPEKCTTYGCLICCCADLQHNFISRV